MDHRHCGVVVPSKTILWHLTFSIFVSLMHHSWLVKSRLGERETEHNTFNLQNFSYIYSICLVGKKWFSQCKADLAWTRESGFCCRLPGTIMLISRSVNTFNKTSNTMKIHLIICGFNNTFSSLWMMKYRLALGGCGQNNRVLTPLELSQQNTVTYMC